MQAFRRARGGGADARPGRTVGGVVGRAAWIAYRLLLSTAVILLGAGLVLYLLLLRGPVAIPGAAAWIGDELTAELDGFLVEVGDVVFALADGGRPAGVRLRDLRLASADGAPLLEVPELSGRFATGDLIRGRIRPLEIVLSGVEARIIREPDGRFLFGLGTDGQGGLILGEGGEEAGTAAAVARILDAISGDGPPPVEALARLDRVRIEGARLAYADRMGGSAWVSDGAGLELWRVPGGAELRLDALISPAVPGDGPPGTQTATRVLVEGSRRAGADASILNITLRDARPAGIASQFAALEWLELIDAPIDGEIAMVVADDGALRGFGGRISARGGQVVATASGALSIERFEAAFRLDEEIERVWLENALLVSAPLTARVSGFLDLTRDAAGELETLVTQLDVSELALDRPDFFDSRLAFDAGRITARLWLGRLRFEIGEARLSRGDLTVEATGRAVPLAEGWRTDLRVAAREVSVGDLVAHWPLFAAQNPRDWIADRVDEGVIEELLAHVRLGTGEPEVALDFRLRDAEVRYVPGMPPVAEARGRGHLAGERFALALGEGRVTPSSGGPIRLDGSTFAIPDVSLDVPYGEVELAASGGLGDVLRLIDTPPLGLLSRLGTDLGPAGGRASVRASVGFPLLNDLPIGDVRADVEATITDLRLSPALGSAGRIAVAGPRVTVAADDRGMRIAGRVNLDGTGFDLLWSESFGGGRGRSLTLNGVLGRERLAALAPGIGSVLRSGQVPVRLDLTDRGGGAMGFALRADLGPAALAVPELLWRKGQGTAGRLTAEGSFGDRLEITSFSVAAGDLEAAGALSLTGSGGLGRLSLSRLVLGRRADLAVEVWRDNAGAIRARAAGRQLDLTEFLAEGTGGDDGAGEPIRAELAIDRLLLSENLALTGAAGELIRTADGRAQARLEGRVGGGAGVVLTYAGGGGRDERLTVTSEDAGAVLASGGYFEGGTGGSLRLDALITPTPGVEAQGLLRIRDMRVRQAPTLSAMLASGDAADLSTEVSSGGLRFREIEVPFVYGGGQLRLTDVIATSPSLAIKVEGTYDEIRDAVDLRGVLSPAYAVTGFLNRIPLLGTILSGGEGEGIFAMTFTVTGPAASPDFDVQPLSLLAPGILRKIFTGAGGSGALPPREFMERIDRDDR